MGGATSRGCRSEKNYAISIHAPRGGSDKIDLSVYPPSIISIHAPRGGGSDMAVTQRDTKRSDFNPRSPWGERQRSHCATAISSVFQSTLPAGGATNATKQHLLTEQFQSTLPVGGATPSSLLCFVLYHISIHAPREGSDLPILVNRRFLIKFQSTLPVGGATGGHADGANGPMRISIHAPREGSD